jgi:hypothetical protein
MRIELGVQRQRPERLRSVACPLAELLDLRRDRRIPFEQGHVTEQRDRMVVLDPVVLGTDQLGDRGGRRSRQHRLSGDAETGQVLQQPLVVPALLIDVALKVVGQDRGDRVTI